MSPLLQAFFLSMLPIFELRGGIPLALAQGVDPLTAFLVCVLANLLVIPFGYLFLTYAHEHLLALSWYEKFFTKKIERARKSFEKHVGTKGEFIALLLLVAIPLPMTGAYTGTLLAWFFKMEKKQAFLALSLGVIIAGVIVTSVVVLGLEGLSFLLKH